MCFERDEEQKTHYLSMLGHRRTGLVTAHHEAGLLARHRIGKESGRIRQARAVVVTLPGKAPYVAVDRRVVQSAHVARLVRTGIA